MNRGKIFYYPAIFRYLPLVENKDGTVPREYRERILVIVPDFAVDFVAPNEREAFAMARDRIGFLLVDCPPDRYPKETPLEKLSLRPDERTVLLEIHLAAYRSRKSSSFVTRAITLPAWMNADAMELGVNISADVQQMLAEKYHLVRDKSVHELNTSTKNPHTR